MTHQEPRLEEEALNKATEMQLSSQLDAAEKIDVDIETDLLKIIQGQADSAKITGQGLVMEKDIRVQEMELYTDNININPISAVFGQIKLDQPIDAEAYLLLTEPDINRALNSDYMRSKMQNIELKVEDKTAIVEPKHLKLFLPEDGKITFSADTVLHDELGKTKQIHFAATMLVKTEEQSLLMEGFNCTPGQGISLEFALAFIQKLREMVNSPYIELQGMLLRIKNVDVQKGKLKLYAQAHVSQLPSS